MAIPPSFGSLGGSGGLSDSTKQGGDKFDGRNTVGGSRFISSGGGSMTPMIVMAVVVVAVLWWGRK